MIRILGQSQFQDWENHYYVDQRLLTNSVKWILQFQRRDGSFGEKENYISPLDRRLLILIIEVAHICIFSYAPFYINMQPLYNSTFKGGHTAHVLLSLCASSESLDGAVKVATASAKVRAVR